MRKKRGRSKKAQSATFALLAPLVVAQIAAQPVEDPLLDAASPSALRQRPIRPGALPFDPAQISHPAPQPNATSVFAGAAPMSRPATLYEGPFRLGPVNFRPHADYTATFGSGISSSPGQQRSTAQHRISPGLLVESSHFAIDYTPSLTYYSDDAFRDTVEHFASFTAAYGRGDWDFRLNHAYAKTSSPLVETATQTDQSSHSTAFSAAYQWNDKISFEFGVDQRIQSAQALNSSRQWSTTDWVNYHYSENTTFGLGAAFGYVDVSRSSDMAYEQLLARVLSRFTEKLSAELSGGVEVRQMLDEDTDDRINPIMSARVTYIPWVPTTFSVSADRSVETSLFEGAVTENTHFQVMLQQRLLGRFYLNLDGGYRLNEMEGGVFGDEAGRTDHLTTFSVALRATILTRGSASVFYRHTDNDSSAELFTFNSDQYGFQVGYRF